MVLGDRLAHGDRRRFLKRVAADHRLRHLPGDGDDRHAVELGVGQRRHEVGRSRAAGRHADADFAGRAGHALRGESAPLLVAREHGADLVLELEQGLMQGHAGPAGISENALDPLPDKCLDQNFSAVIALLLGGSFGRFGLGSRRHGLLFRLVDAVAVAGSDRGGTAGPDASVSGPAATRERLGTAILFWTDTVVYGRLADEARSLGQFSSTCRSCPCGRSA